MQLQLVRQNKISLHAQYFKATFFEAGSDYIQDKLSVTADPAIFEAITVRRQPCRCGYGVCRPERRL